MAGGPPVKRLPSDRLSILSPARLDPRRAAGRHPARRPGRCCRWSPRGCAGTHRKWSHSVLSKTATTGARRGTPGWPGTGARANASLDSAGRLHGEEHRGGPGQEPRNCLLGDPAGAGRGPPLDSPARFHARPLAGQLRPSQRRGGGCGQIALGAARSIRGLFMRPLAPPSPPAPPPAAYELDMTTREDEPLVVLAQECGYRPARNELLRRCLRLSGELVGHYAARAGLQEADCQDAQQDAVLWSLEAIAHYRTDEFVRPGGCRFRSFLHRVLTARLIDSLRHRRCLQAHFPLIEAGTLDRNENSDCRRHRGATGGGAGPLREAEERELGACLDRAVGGFGGPARGMWDLLVTGMRLREIAAALDMSYEIG